MSSAWIDASGRLSSAARSLARLFRSVSTVCGFPPSRAAMNLVTSSSSVNERFGFLLEVERLGRHELTAGLHTDEVVDLASLRLPGLNAHSATPARRCQ